MFKKARQNTKTLVEVHLSRVIHLTAGYYFYILLKMLKAIVNYSEKCLCESQS